MGLYAMIGERMKHVFTGYKVWILSYKDECFEKIGLRPSDKMKVINGSLDCEFRCYDIFEGKNKDYKKALAEGEESSDTSAERPARSFSSDRPARNENSSGGERAPRKEYSERPERKNFKTDRMDRPDRRFAAAHSETE
jgi:putative N6-adenine-specific DNA methylase